MRVWLVNHYALPPQRAGGTRHYALARELIRRGHEVTLIASSVDYMRRQEAHLAPNERARLEQVGEVPFLWLRTLPYQGNSLRRVGNMLSFAFRLRREAPRALPRPDVVVGSTPHLFAAWAAYRLARRYQVPFVLEVRDLWPEFAIDMGVLTNPILIRTSRWLESFLYNRADHLLVNSPAIKIICLGEEFQRLKSVSFLMGSIRQCLIRQPREYQYGGNLSWKVSSL
jgi:glycosyltransferase involved in cell wall biosynthesis